MEFVFDNNKGPIYDFYKSPVGREDLVLFKAETYMPALYIKQRTGKYKHHLSTVTVLHLDEINLDARRFTRFGPDLYSNRVQMRPWHTMKSRERRALKHVDWISTNTEGHWSVGATYDDDAELSAPAFYFEREDDAVLFSLNFL